MEKLLATYLGFPLPLKDQAVLQLSGYDMDYWEYEQDNFQVLIYRSHKNPVMTKVIMSQGGQEFNITLPQDHISVSHFLAYYLAQEQLTPSQLALVVEHLESVGYLLKDRAQFYQSHKPQSPQVLSPTLTLADPLLRST